MLDQVPQSKQNMLEASCHLMHCPSTQIQQSKDTTTTFLRHLQSTSSYSDTSPTSNGTSPARPSNQSSGRNPSSSVDEDVPIRSMTLSEDCSIPCDPDMKDGPHGISDASRIPCSTSRRSWRSSNRHHTRAPPDLLADENGHTCRTRSRWILRASCKMPESHPRCGYRSKSPR